MNEGENCKSATQVPTRGSDVLRGDLDHLHEELAEIRNCLLDLESEFLGKNSLPADTADAAPSLDRTGWVKDCQYHATTCVEYVMGIRHSIAALQQM